MPTVFTPTPLDQLSSELIVAMSPAELLNRDPDDRVLVADHRGDAVEEAAARVERLQLDLAAAERALEYSKLALDVASAIAHPAIDHLHGRHVGDVIEGAHSPFNAIVLGITRTPFGVLYFVLRDGEHKANTGDGVGPVWVPSHHFRTPVEGTS